MTQEQEKFFENELREQLEKARLQGVGIGAKSISKVIYDKTNGDLRSLGKNDLIRVVKDIRKFCETGLGIKEDELS